MNNRGIYALMVFLRFLALLITFFPVGTSAEMISGRVIGVSDGDTLTLLDAANVSHKIRLSGVDAPEKNQDFGQRAKTHLSTMAYNQVSNADCRKTDRYRRRICVVFVEGQDLGLEQIRAGMAWWYRQYAKEQKEKERDDYERAESEAKYKRSGLWNSKEPMPPWEWRHGR